MISIKTEIIKNTLLKNNVHQLVLHIDNMLEIQCGQFVMVDCGSSDGITLKRPISIHSFDKNTITLMYQVVGKGTKALSKKSPNTYIDVIMPLGNGFDVKDEYNNIALVGGGLGIFPLFSIIKQYPYRQYYAYLGCKDKQSFVGEENFISSCQNTVITTDDGSKGCKGFVTDFVKKDLQKFDAIFACGPKPMLKALKNIVKDVEIPVFVSMEERMGCGFGGCLVCTCKTTKGNRRVCADGPVFDIREVEL